MTRHRRFASRLTVAMIAGLLGACAPAPSPSEASSVAITSPSPSATDAPSASTSPTASASSTATASPTPTPSPTPTATPVPSIVKCPGAATRQSALTYPYTATEFVGYAIGRPNAKITCVEATWTQPKVTCTKADQRFAISISIDGWTSSRLHVNAPSPRLVSVGTEAECIDGKPVISTWHQANPLDFFEYFSGLQALTPAVGDIIWAQIRYSNGAFTMAIRDKTSGEQASVTQTVARIARVAAVWEVSTVSTNCATKCRLTPLAKFSPIVFSGVEATMGGKLYALGGPGVVDWVQDATKKGVKRMVAGAIQRFRSFTVTWKHI